MKNINNFRNILILFSIITLLKITEIDAYIFRNDNRQPPRGNAINDYQKKKENELVDGMMMFPDDGFTPKPRLNSLSIYNSDWMYEPKKDKRYVAKLANRLSDFHTKLTSTILAAKPGENVIYSPISVSMLLSVMGYGARYNTSDEITNALGLTYDFVTNGGYYQLGDILKNSDGVVLNFLNQIFTSTDIQLDNFYQRVSETIYRANTQKIDFSNTDKAAIEINNWCKKATNNHIKEIVNADDLDDVLMVLANAIYFEGSWAIPFDPEETVIQDFHINKNKSVSAQLMFQSDEYNHGYIKELNADYIELPYKHKENTDDYFSMYLLVPKEIDGLERIEQNLDLIDFKRLDGLPSNIDILLPKFKIEQTIDLSPVLEKMGIRSMFTDAADFSGMSYSNVHVSKMIQKAYLEVDEIGSKAAGVSGASISWHMLPPVIRADKPFLCAIVVKSLGVPLFFARIADPTQFL